MPFPPLNQDGRMVKPPVRPGFPDAEDHNSGPQRIKVARPNTSRILKRMKEIDPDTARRYRQGNNQ